MSRQCVISATSIVTCAFAGVFTEKYATGIDDLARQLVVILSLNDKVLRCIGIRKVDGLLFIVNKHQATVLKSFLSNLLARQ